MLDVINKALRDTINESRGTNGSYAKRKEYALSVLDGWFDRKEYMIACKGISSATASRDLKQLIEERLLDTSGTGRMTKYKKRTG